MSATIDNGCNIPQWIVSELFENVVRQTLEDFQKISAFNVFPALAPGENYCSTMLKIQLVIQLNDDSLENRTYMLKIPNHNQHMQEQWDAWRQFETESKMYHQIVPEFEQLYREVGREVSFAPKVFTLPVSHRYLLLEDLSRRGFKTLKRQNCLDMEHCKAVLRKMAQWHAASALRMQMQDDFTSYRGVLNEEAKLLLDNIFNDAVKNTLKAVKNFPHHQEYYQKFEHLSLNFADKLRNFYQVNSAEFNVLNHGDCWSNNIMFQYDEQNRLQSINFVDLQVPLYGSPAMDLYYFIFSSAKLELKIAHFDEMIKYYHNNLIENLLLLKYDRQLPTLRHLHQMLLKYGIWGIFAACTILPGVLCEPTGLANIYNFMDDSEDADKFMDLMYRNSRYWDHLKLILPWLNSRGAFDC